MQNKLNYGVDFLRDLKIIAPKKVTKTKVETKPKALTLNEQIEAFKKFHNIPQNKKLQADFKLVDDQLNVKRNLKWVPLYSRNKPLSNTTLQAKYGAKFLRDLNIPTMKNQKTRISSASV